MSLAPYGEAVLCPFKRLDRALPIPLDLPAITATFPVRSNKSVMTNLQFKGTSRFEMGGEMQNFTLPNYPDKHLLSSSIQEGKLQEHHPELLNFDDAGQNKEEYCVLQEPSAVPAITSE